MKFKTHFKWNFTERRDSNTGNRPGHVTVTYFTKLLVVLEVTDKVRDNLTI